MNEKKRETIQNAVYAWEIGMLQILYKNGILTDEEYEKIRKIADNQAQHNIYLS